MKPVEKLYEALVGAGVDPIEGRPMILYAAKSGGAIGIVGRHAPTGLCWCQPVQDPKTEVFVHKRVMDMDDDVWDELNDGTWSFSMAGVVPDDQGKLAVSGAAPLV